MILVAAAGSAVGVALLWRRRPNGSPLSGYARQEPEKVSPPSQQAHAEPSASPETAVTVVEEGGAVPSPAARENESLKTEETKYERLAERESQERHAAAARLRSDPLTEKLS
jgi:hypothetical protein